MISLRQRRLPLWLQEVEYIGATGTQFLDTGVQVNTISGDVVEQKIRVKFASSSSRYLFGHNGFGYFGKNARNNLECPISIPKSYNIAGHFDNFTLKATYSDRGAVQIYYGSALVASGNHQSAGEKVYHIAAFTIANAISSTTPYETQFNCVADLAWETIKINNVLVRNLIPCYAVSSGTGYKGSTAQAVSAGEIGMYDTVEGKLYINSGTGVFTKGADVKTVSGITVNGNEVSKEVINGVTTFQAPTYLYKEGDECTSLTGGWVKRQRQLADWLSASYYDGSILVKNAGNMAANFAAMKYYYIETANDIDFTNYKKLFVRFNCSLQSGLNYAPRICVGSRNGYAASMSVSYTLATQGSQYTNYVSETDVSALTGNQCVCLFAAGADNKRIDITHFDIWLE